MCSRRWGARIAVSMIRAWVSMDIGSLCNQCIIRAGVQRLVVWLADGLCVLSVSRMPRAWQ